LRGGHLARRAGAGCHAPLPRLPLHAHGRPPARARSPAPAPRRAGRPPVARLRREPALGRDRAGACARRGGRARAGRAAAPRAALQPHELREAPAADRPHQPRRLMGRLVLIRHGESEGNRDRVFTHTPEVPLTEAGRAQVRRAAEWIAARYRPLGIVSSPFLRARQTATVLAEWLALPVRVEEDLREQSYGELAGQPYAALRDASDYDPERYWLWRPPGGETLVEVAARAALALDRVGAGARGDHVVVG